MVRIGRNPALWLALGALILALIAWSRFTGGPNGPVCVELPAAGPGFSGLTAGTNPACIRIRLP